ncbi:zwei Ig domain protein zig-2-like [Limulus polyphemus]|uniref:Zwei Ig domain protein zig-2-like n=1 Tax=Limulus polyphemus TaxID=6850 RepID=A0ABM1T6A5_LIMPO|nr:zwei Ig domain protein zig-2-like [Limulus polyphemus]
MSKEGVVVKEPLCFKETLIGLPARIYMWTRFRFERQGNDVQLFCRSSELPESYVTWSRGEENAQLENGEKYMILNNGDLIIRDISWEDMGIYTCNARNAFGSDTALAFLYPVKI